MAPQRLRTSPRSLAPALGLILFACQSAGGLGSVPASVVELYDAAAPEGTIELEVDRDGTIREMEAEIPIDDLPEAVRAAAMRRAPGGRIVGAEREFTQAGRAFEVKVVHEARHWEFVVDTSGNVLEIEKELRDTEVPAGILEAADRAFPQGDRKSVEVVEHRDQKTFHVKKQVGDASYKIVLRPDGTVDRVVREARAEIEIPLAR